MLEYVEYGATFILLVKQLLDKCYTKLIRQE